MEPSELLKHATEFVFKPFVAEGEEEVEALRHFKVYVQYRSPGKYAVSWMGEVWNGKEFIYENLPSSRTEKFLKNTRFSLDEAIAIAAPLPDKLIINGKTYREWYEFQRSK